MIALLVPEISFLVSNREIKNMKLKWILSKDFIIMLKIALDYSGGRRIFIFFLKIE